MDLNIIIRSFVTKDALAYVRAGAGIVGKLRSGTREYSETLKKAEALIRTLEDDPEDWQGKPEPASLCLQIFDCVGYASKVPAYFSSLSLKILDLAVNG